MTKNRIREKCVSQRLDHSTQKSTLDKSETECRLRGRSAGGASEMSEGQQQSQATLDGGET